MRLQGTQYFQKAVVIPDTTTSDLAEYDIRTLPLVVGALETRKASSFYASEADWLRGTLSINRLQKELLMGAKKDIIAEIRHVRGREGGTLAELDIDVVGIGLYAGTQLLDISTKLGPDGFTNLQGELENVNVKLQTLIDNAQTPEDTENILSLLAQIAGLLA